MITCTYVILLNNNQDNIVPLVRSLKDLQGNFRKEFIFIDDGSTDDTLIELKKIIASLPRSTIITQQHEGPALSINKAAKLISGDFIHFVEGDEFLRPDATAVLINACIEHGTEVALGKVKKDKLPVGKIKPQIKVIEQPLAQILDNKIEELTYVGKSGSLMSRNLLEKIGLADPAIYVQNMSLSLRAAKYSKFALIEDFVSFKPEITDIDKKFESYNYIKAIYNFSINHKELCKNLVPNLLSALSKQVLEGNNRIKYKLMAIAVRYIKITSLDKVLDKYKLEFEKLF